ncbi:MAG: ribosome silencing factor [Tissierellia bacterium]|nr:ribosome silencing factor [Tissierellia bacterium]
MEELIKQIEAFMIEKQASDIACYDARGGSLADYYMICSALNKRHLGALAKDIEKFVEKQGVPIFIRQGTSESGWIILDFMDIVIHCFDAETREFYNLERLWEAMKQ